MELDKRCVHDLIGTEIKPGDIVAVSVDNKQRIGIISEINWNSINFCGKEKSYPLLKLLMVSTRWDKDLQRSVGFLRKVKLTKTSNLICLGDGYLDKLKSKSSDMNNDIIALFEKEKDKTSKLKLAS